MNDVHKDAVAYVRNMCECAIPGCGGSEFVCWRSVFICTLSCQEVRADEEDRPVGKWMSVRLCVSTLFCVLLCGARKNVFYQSMSLLRFILLANVSIVILVLYVFRFSVVNGTCLVRLKNYVFLGKCSVCPKTI